MLPSHTKANARTRQRSASYDEAYKSQHSDISRLQDWRVKHDAYLAQARWEEARSLKHSSKVIAHVIKIPSPEDDVIPMLERQHSFIPVSSPVHSAAVYSMESQPSHGEPVNLAGQSSTQGSAQDSGEVFFV